MTASSSPSSSPISWPDRIRLGAQIFSLRFVPEGDLTPNTLCGAVRYGTSEILVSSGMSLDCTLSTLWHEAVHVWLGALELDDQGEQIANLVAEGLLGLHRDHPDLIRDILDALNPPKKNLRPSTESA